MVLVQLALAAQVIGMAYTTKDKSARAVGICKIVLVTLGLFFVWQPNFDIFSAIQTIDDGIPGYDQMAADFAFIMDPANAATYSANTTAIVEKLQAKGGKMIKPQLDIGKEASGWELVVVWALTLLISLADEIELLVLKKLAKKDAMKAEGVLADDTADKSIPAPITV